MMKISLESLQRIGVTLQVVKSSLAAGIAWMLASLLPHSPYPVFAPLAAILIMQVTIGDSIEKAIYRILGVIGGVSVGVLVGKFFSVGTISVALVVLIGMSISTALRLHEQIISQVGVSALLVLDYGRMQGYVADRIGETVIGAVVAVAINILIYPPKSSPVYQERIRALAKGLAAVLQNIAVHTEKQNLMQGLVDARELVGTIEKDHQRLNAAVRNLRFTPFWRHEHQVMSALSLLMNNIEHMATQVRGIARGLLDLQAVPELHAEFLKVLQATARCISLFGEVICYPSGESIHQLRQALAETRCIQSQSFLAIHQSASLPALREAGGVFTDLGRILDEIESSVLQNDSEKLEALLKVEGAS